MVKTNFGFVQWFPFEDYRVVEASLQVMQQLGVTRLRTCFSWADWERPGGKKWFDWLIKNLLHAHIRIYPSLFYTPMRHALLPKDTPRLQAKTCFPPSDPSTFVRFVEKIVHRYGYAFDSVLLWNEPNNTAYWHAELDTDSRIFQKMMLGSIRVLHAEKKKAVIGSLVPPYRPWIEQMHALGVLEQADAVGVHDFPGTWNKRIWNSWEESLEEVRSLIYPGQEIWITETGYSTRTLEPVRDGRIVQQKEAEQAVYFDEVYRLTNDYPVFWYSIFDQPEGHTTDNEANRPDHPAHDPRADGLGILTSNGESKQLFRDWSIHVDPQTFSAASGDL